MNATSQLPWVEQLAVIDGSLKEADLSVGKFLDAMTAMSVHSKIFETQSALYAAFCPSDDPVVLQFDVQAEAFENFGIILSRTLKLQLCALRTLTLALPRELAVWPTEKLKEIGRGLTSEMVLPEKPPADYTQLIQQYEAFIAFIRNEVIPPIVAGLTFDTIGEQHQAAVRLQGFIPHAMEQRLVALRNLMDQQQLSGSAESA